MGIQWLASANDRKSRIDRRQLASFEAPVRMLNGNIGYIDLIWKGKLLVEHKSRGKDLKVARSQGLNYIERLKPHERPRWLVTSDFARFHIHDLHNGHEDSLLLTDLASRAELFGFLAGYEPKRPTSETPVNLEAVARLGGLYDAIKAGGYPDEDLPMFLVRLLFCLFTEDTGVFGRDGFTDFITYRTQEDGSDLGPRLEQFFRVLDTPKDRRQRHTDELLAGLEYVNGALFSGHLAFAEMNSAMRTALLACTEFDWQDVIALEKCSFILGNPPFVGHHYQSDGQKQDQKRIMSGISASGVIDFVANWHMLASAYMVGTKVRAAFVSTNSICQGEQAGLLWSELFRRYNVKIHFGHRTFKWTSEARGKAHVHCVIVGFDCHDTDKKLIYDYDQNPEIPTISRVSNISPYLVAGADLIVTNRSVALCPVPKMSWGNKPTDGGHLILSPEEREELLAKEPAAAKFIRPYMSGGDFIKGIDRYCLWLKDAKPEELRALPMVMARVEHVRSMRLASTAESTRKFASYPTLFRQIAQPNTSYLAIPEVSSERRRFIPIAFVTSDVICSNKIQFVPDATLWHFAVLTSTMQMAWMRQVCGRLKSDYSYSNTLVYNNFPWPQDVTEAQRTSVEKAAQEVLEAREQFPGSTLADLYDPVSMPPRLAKAHESLDRAVDRCYRKEPFNTDRERVEHLFFLYEQFTAPLAVPAKKPRKTKP